ncbi:ABC transporter permease [Occallatibacter savannae]|uniref:ABC transporter permease n=1 Tax=Occallatibacter savannae TaxID=1002691 RepID=UPI000D690FCA|nr:ABC transporter permease [Occallatibacter savannae]
MNPVLDQARHNSFQETLLSARRTMMLSEILKLAIDSFAASKLRFALTALGMVIGTASVILVVTIGLTGRQFILNEIQKIGTNQVEVEYSGGGAVGAEKVSYNDFLTRDDERAVLAQVPSVVASSPVLESHDRISFGGGVVKDTLVLGVSPQYRDVRNLIVLTGRFFDEQDENAHIKCAVVTVPFAREMFGSSEEAVGKQFAIQGIPFTIIGTFKESVDTFGETEIADQTILIPFSVARYITGTDNVKQIYFTIRSMDEVPDATREIQSIIQSRHRPNSVYKTFDLRELLAMADRISIALIAVLVMVAAVTLAVGGVGIMNIMLANVRSRIREIGIRKALGATYREIKLQFLAEAVIISLAGGLVGCFVGLAVPLAIRLFSDYPLPISMWSVVIALAAATAVGVVFGTVPATRAAQMDPVESLKYE